MNFEVKEEEIERLNKCYVGYVHNPNSVYLLQDKIIDEGESSFTITPLGGDTMLIKLAEWEEFGHNADKTSRRGGV